MVRLNDTSEHPTGEWKAHLCAVEVVWSRGSSLVRSTRRTTSHPAVDALAMTAVRRSRDTVSGCVIYADRGAQFRTRALVVALHRHGLRGSVGRVASSADDAARDC